MTGTRETGAQGAGLGFAGDPPRTRPADDERLHLVLASLSAAMLCADQLGRITCASPGLETLLGCDPAELQPGNLVPVDGPPAPPGIAKRVLGLRFGRAWLFGPAISLAQSREEAAGLAAALAAERNARGRSEAAREAAEVASAAKSRFLVAVSQDVQQPVGAILNAARLVAEHASGELRSEYAAQIAQIEAAGHILLRLVDEVVELARAEAGRFALSETEIDISGEISAACRLLAGEAAARRVTLNYELPDDRAHVWGDRTRLRQVLFNLLSNALKFTPEGGHVRVTAFHAAAGTLCIRVGDTGIGIAPAEIERLMQPVDQQAPGAGLGLPLARQILEMHGGSLELRSTQGEGTVVTITLPASHGRPSPR